MRITGLVALTLCGGFSVRFVDFHQIFQGEPTVPSFLVVISPIFLGPKNLKPSIFQGHFHLGSKGLLDYIFFRLGGEACLVLIRKAIFLATKISQQWTLSSDRYAGTPTDATPGNMAFF